MITKHTYGSLQWVDVESPKEDEVRALMSEFSLHPDTANDLLSPTRRPFVESRENYLYLVLHFPALKHTHTYNNDDQEIDFVIGKDFIITNRYETIDPLHKFSKVFEVGSILEKGTTSEHAGYIFFTMVRKMYKSIEHELSSIRDDIERIEESIFSGNEKEMVVELSVVGRNLLNLRQSLATHRDILASLKDVSNTFFGQDFSRPIDIILNDYYRIFRHIETHSEWLKELRDTNNSLLSTKQNEIMKVLTIMAFVTFPLSLISSTFGMNTENLPIVGSPHDFWIIISGMAILSASFFVFFWYKKWL